MTEKTLRLAWWQTEWQRPQRTTDGQRVRVQFPGWWNYEGGPDFLDALVRIGKHLQRGDIEIHRFVSDWRAHGHHRNPAFRHVVLHVVSRMDRTTQHHSIPTIEVHPGPRVRRRQGPRSAQPSPMAPGYPQPITLAKLRELGMRRFGAKRRRIRRWITRFGVEGGLYYGLLDALGYKHNRHAFRELAVRLPLAKAKTLLRHNPTGLRHRFHQEAKALQWSRAWVRPANTPASRIEGLLHLLARCDGQLAKAVLTAACSPKPLSTLVKTFEVSLPNGGPAYIGKERALAIVINVVLPWLAARSVRQGRSADSSGLAFPARALYQSAPALAENTLTRRARTWHHVPHPLSACAQQGLHLLANRYLTISSQKLHINIRKFC